MAKTQRQQLAGDRARLAADTAALMGELQAESARVAFAWRAMPAAVTRLPAAEAGPIERLPAVEVKEAPKWLPAAKVKEAPAARVEAAPAAEEEETEAEHVGDDLTAIRGIGRGTQQHLKKAGIYTFAQLAASTPEELRQALGTVRGRLANVEEWIEQARELSK